MRDAMCGILKDVTPIDSIIHIQFIEAEAK